MCIDPIYPWYKMVESISPLTQNGIIHTTNGPMWTGECNSIFKLVLSFLSCLYIIPISNNYYNLENILFILWILSFHNEIYGETEIQFGIKLIAVKINFSFEMFYNQNAVLFCTFSIDTKYIMLTIIMIIGSNLSDIGLHISVTTFPLVNKVGFSFQ